MSWPIPEIPKLPKISKPKYKVWLYSFVFLSCIAYFFLTLFGEKTGYTNIFLYLILPVLLIWISVFGVTIHRYEYYLASQKAWEKESAYTTHLWQEWSKWQQAVLGNVVLSPEEEGASVMLGDIKNIPMYPEKCRPLFGERKGFAEYLLTVHLELEQQLPEYRNHLFQIYLLCSDKLYLKNIIDDIFNQWLLVPDVLDLNSASELVQEDAEYKGGVLLLCVNCWPHHADQEHSEFITAQLISSVEYAREYQLPVLAALGRAMPLDNMALSNDLEMLFKYNEIEKTELQHVWLVGESQKSFEGLVMFAEEAEWLLPEKSPAYRVNLSFGPSHELLFFNSLALVTDAVIHTQQDQLLISQDSASTNFLCLIKKDFFK